MADRPWLTKDNYYGKKWGDPASSPHLKEVVARYITPFVGPETVVMEIGPGGGRWTGYLAPAKKLWLVELNPVFFDLLAKRFAGANVSCYETKGYELNGVPACSVDFVFSFGCLAHIDQEGIETYLRAIWRVLKPGGTAALQYADKTKDSARKNPLLSNMTPQRMREMLRGRYKIIRHDLNLLPHAGIVAVRKSAIAML